MCLVSVDIYGFEKASYNFSPAHYHRNKQIIWLIDGEMEYKLGEEKTVLTKDSLLFLNRTQVHRSKLITDTAKMMLIDFDLHFLEQDILDNEILPNIDEVVNYYITEVPFPLLYLFHDYKKINEEEGSLSRWHSLNIASVSLQYITQAIKKGKVQANRGVSESDQSIFRKIIDFINNNYMDDITIDMIATVAHTNKNYVTTLFKNYTDLTPMRYINKYRLFMAKELLKTTDYSISSVAIQVGYNHSSYFVKSFKQQYGLTPLQFRKQEMSKLLNPTEKSTF